MQEKDINICYQNDCMNIVLIGFRGTGKTTVGKKLAKKLKMKYVSTDKQIEKKTAMSIKKIVKKFGWKKFRAVESKVVEDISKKDNLIVDCGGGVILKKENVKNLKKNGVLILLTADVETIKKRIKKSRTRPPLKGYNFLNEIKDVLTERRKKYKAAADHTINTSNLGIDEVTKKIIQFIRIKS